MPHGRNTCVATSDWSLLAPCLHRTLYTGVDSRHAAIAQIGAGLQLSGVRVHAGSSGSVSEL